MKWFGDIWYPVVWWINNHILLVFAGLSTVTFVCTILKRFQVIDWSWGWVWSPLWVPLIVCSVLVCTSHLWKRNEY